MNTTYKKKVARERFARYERFLILLQRIQPFLDRKIVSVMDIAAFLGYSRAQWYLWASKTTYPSEKALQALSAVVKFLVMADDDDLLALQAGEKVLMAKYEIVLADVDAQ